MPTRHHQYRHEQQRDHLILQALNEGVWDLDVQSGQILCDERWYRLLGYTPEAFAMSLDYWHLLLHPEDQPLLNGELRSKIRSGEPFVFEFRCRTREEQWLWVEARGQVVAWDGPQPLRVLGTYADISRRKAQELALRSSEERLRMLLGSMQDQVMMLDTWGKLVEFHLPAAYAGLYPVTHTLIGQEYSSVLPASAIEPFDTALGGILDNGHSRTFEYTHPAPPSGLTPEGGDFIFQVTLSQISGLSTFPDGFLAVIRDVSRERRNEQALIRQRNALQRLNEIASLPETAPADMVHAALAVGCEHLGLDYGLLHRVSEGRCVVKAHHSPPKTIRNGQGHPLEESWCGLILARQDVLALSRADHPRYARHAQNQHLPLKSLIGIPVLAHGVEYGTLCFGSPTVGKDNFDLSDIEFVRLLGRWVGSWLERQDMMQQLRIAATAFQSQEGIMVTDAQRNILRVNDAFERLTGYRASEIIGHNPRLLKSGKHDADFYRRLNHTLAQTGYWQGEICNRRKGGGELYENLTISAVKDDKGRITHYVGTFVDISAQKEHQQMLEHLALYDALTRLPNRVLLAARMQEAMLSSQENGNLLMVVYLDLDDFKPVNDTYGHMTGDQLLVEVAQRLCHCVRSQDTVARLGGDEFVLLLSGLHSQDECQRALTRILESIAIPYQLHQHTAHISASIGATLYPPDGSDPDTLLRHADQAMYQAKQRGRNCFVFF